MAVGNYLIEFRVSKDAPAITKDEVENVADILLDILELCFSDGYVLYTLGEESCEEDGEE